MPSNKPKWPDKLFPIKIYIGFYHWYDYINFADRNTYEILFLKALETWTKVSGNKVRFDILNIGGNNLYNSQINVMWRTTTRKTYAEYHIDTEGDKIFGANITFYLNKNDLDQKVIYNLMLKNIGYTLGVENFDELEDLYGCEGKKQEKPLQIQSRELLDETQQIGELNKYLMQINNLNINLKYKN